MGKEEYISISEFAKRAGVSRQAIYSRIKKDLTVYCKVDNDKNVISTKALKLFDVKKDVSVDFTPKFTKSDNLTDVLISEIEVKNQQIKDMQATIDKLQAVNQKLVDDLTELNGKLVQMNGKVTETLQNMTQAQLADKMIEGKKMLEDQNEPPKKWWHFW